MTHYGACSVTLDRSPGHPVDAAEARLLPFAHWARRELLYEKIRARVERDEGQRLADIADAVVEAAKAARAGERDAERKREELRKKLQAFLES
ncbi:MAG: hypothetical protein QXO51_01365 [Halobacteria archaeon]